MLDYFLMLARFRVATNAPRKPGQLPARQRSSGPRNSPRQELQLGFTASRLQWWCESGPRAPDLTKRAGKPRFQGGRWRLVMAEKEIEVFETTAGQVADVLKRLGVPKKRMITVMIEPDDWLTKARQGSRRLVIQAGLSDEDIDRMIKQAQKEVEPPLG
jgi:hypothetical protein